MLIQKKKQVAFLLHAPAIGSPQTILSDAKAVPTEGRLQAQSSLVENSDQPPRQIKRTQFGKNRIPKQFLLSQTS